MNVKTIIIVAFALVVSACPVRAEVTMKDLQIIGRALGFTDTSPVGELVLGIVYVPGNPQSAKEADDVRQMLGSGLKTGSVILKPLLVKIDEAGIPAVGAFLLTEAVGAEAVKLAAVTKAERKPCVTVDIAQVRSGTCVIGVKSEPRVEITVNKAAAAETGVGFAAAFRMMVTEL